MDYRESAKQVFELIGGKSNLISAAHCATRLRLVVADESVCKKGAIENVDGVKGVFSASGQLQIIFGTGTVNKVYEEFIAVAGITAASKDEVKQAAAKKGNPFQRAIKALGDVFVPIIPAIYAGGDFMRPVYTDLYALFRRDPGAEEYFNQLPAYVQDQLSARCRAVDSLERLHAYADQFQAKGSPELVEEIGGKAFLPPPFRP